MVDSGPLLGSVAVPVLHTRAGEARVGEGRILSLLDEFPRVCFKEWPIRIMVQCANPRVQETFDIQASVFIPFFAFGHRAFVVLMRQSLSPGLQCVPGVEKLEAHSHILKDLFSVFEVHSYPKWAVGGIVAEVALVEAAPMIASGLQVLAYPAARVGGPMPLCLNSPRVV